MRCLFLVSVILSILCAGCSDDKLFKNKYTLVPIDSVRIEISSNSKNFTEIQSFDSDQTEFIATLNNIENSIEFYNLETQKYFKEISIAQEGSNAFGKIESFYIISFDSILVFSSGRPKIGLLDGNGVIKKSISYDKDYLGKEVSSLTATGGVKPLKINNHVFLPQIYRALESNGILTEAGQLKSSIAISANISSGQVITLPLTYPEELIGKDVSAMPYRRIQGSGNSFIYHFGNLQNFYVTNDNRSFVKYPIETIYDLKTGESLNAFTDIKRAINQIMQSDEIISLSFDKFRNCYYIFIRKRENNYNVDTNVNEKRIFPNCFILILDKNLKHIGEVHFPDDIYSFRMCFISEKGLYISEDHINNPSFSEDYMKFRLFRLEKARN